MEILKNLFHIAAMTVTWGVVLFLCAAYPPLIIVFLILFCLIAGF